MNKMLENQLNKINKLKQEIYNTKSYYRLNDLNKQLKEEQKQLNIAKRYVDKNK